jgi:hypothetical protein
MTIPEDYLEYLESHGGLETDEFGHTVLTGLTFEETLDYLSYAAQSMIDTSDDLRGRRYLSLARKHCAAYRWSAPAPLSHGDATLH